MSKKVNILIVEDEIVIAEDIKQGLEEVGYDVLGVARDYEGTIKVFDMEMPSLVLLDITLKGEKTGIDIARYIRSHFEIPFVFITSHANKQTLGQAIETKPNGYLVKPFNQDDLYASIELALNNFTWENQSDEVSDARLERPFKDSIFIKSGGVFQRVRFAAITYLEAEGAYTNIYLTQGKKMTERQVLLEFENKLRSNRFLRVHRSYLINLDRVEGIKNDRVIVDGKEIPLGRTYKEQLMQFIDG